jgi:glycyl-tRNA synthetase
MVVEMTSLQGIMGSLYARRSHEGAAVATAIAEQYNSVSRSRPGLALALSDRLDSLVGLFAAGLAVKGSNDPFALRRAAIQIVENLIANEAPLELGEALQAAAALQPLPAGEPVIATVLEFIAGRLEVVLADRGYPVAIIRAALARRAANPYLAERAAAALQEAVATPDWPRLLDAYARCVRISRGQPAHELRPAELVLNEERALLAAYEQAAASLNGRAEGLVAALQAIEPAITRFFDRVLVMDPDEAVRQNRLALLQRVASLPASIADLSQLEGF